MVGLYLAYFCLLGFSIFQVLLNRNFQKRIRNLEQRLFKDVYSSPSIVSPFWQRPPRSR